ncbi:hypothetical protein [Halogranum rubrum]|uniref:TraC-like domain-containing protein n=1 Tax=Halogranum salarium B-1 TaxID=1210908 RepID=J3JCT4_9EURY|nr:hypothetical protein [Halogranum salarium]EJN56889.1 hypothetical protein HSB1_47060 [Halogranum salarium B-1]
MGSATSTDDRPDAPESDDTADSDSTEGPRTHDVGADEIASSHNGDDSIPKSDLEVLRELDKFLDDIDTDLPTARQRARARDHFELEDKLGGKRTTQDKLGFDYVRDDGIAVDGDSYIGLLKVHPQNWLSLSEEAKRDTMSAYMSFLMSLESSVAVPCYPKTFDLTGHLERFYTAGASMASRGQTPILQYGRKFYIQWANTNIEEEDLKQRDFYVVTRVEAEQVHKNLDTGSALSQIESIPLVGAVSSWVAGWLPGVDTHEEARTELCIREVQQRQRRILNKLGRTDVSISRVTDRQETMEILYHYYNHVDPQFERFDHATSTAGDI